VAHPDLVPVAKAVFDAKLGDKPHQKERLREDVSVCSEQLIDFRIEGGKITEAGLRNNISVGIQYIEAWLRGSGAVAIFNLMEDAATAEISRAQIWQWIRSPHGVLDDGRKVTLELVRALADEEADKVKSAIGDDVFEKGRFAEARQLFDRLIADDDFAEFLTLSAYARID
jgi:malate synthase